MNTQKKFIDHSFITIMNHSAQNTILITAYAVNPYKGSEDGMGWNFILQAAKNQQVIAVTRINNGPHIRKYMQEHPEQQMQFSNVQFLYFDWPRWMIFWKKGPILSLIYFYMWQLTLALWLLTKKFSFDIAHNLNFHNDWTPSFLWLLGKPFVWGPVGHHPKIGKEFLLKHYGRKAYLQDRMLWLMKCWFWYVDPFVYISKWRAAHIFCMNEDAAKKLRLSPHRYSIMPSVASDALELQLQIATTKPDTFQVISVGRFVALKGFDISIQSFAAFYHTLPQDDQQKVSLTLVGQGPAKQMLQTMIEDAGIASCSTIIEWIPKSALDEVYRNSSVFLFPSHEGAGMVVAEAMSYGLPVLCFQNEGPGAFVHPQSALPVSYGKYDEVVKAFAEKLHVLHSNQDAYQQEVALSLRRFQESFLWSVRGGAMKACYEKVILPVTNMHTNPAFRL